MSKFPERFSVVQYASGGMKGTTFKWKSEETEYLSLEEHQAIISDIESRLQIAMEALEKFPTGHNHWDSEGTHGQNCLICKAQIEHKNKALEKIKGEMK